MAIFTRRAAVEPVAPDNSAAAIWRAMLDDMPINVMLADLATFQITYANKATLRTLQLIEHAMPIKVDKLIGSSIDVFHKHPAHQRGLLTDRKNLPHTARIKLGSDTLELRLSPVDVDGVYTAAMVTWSLRTAEVRLVAQVDQDVNAIAGVAEAMNAAAATVAAAADGTRGKVSTVAAAAEELSVSAREISRQIIHATEAVTSAADQAHSSDTEATKLMEAASSIGGVVTLIRGIAEQTNLLALNATIEAARAGEAGRGFAVVAQEVKTLAAQAAKATETIEVHIGAMRQAGTAVAQAVSGITGSMSDLSGIMTAVSAAIEEQNAATAEVSASIAQVSDAAHSADTAAASVLQAAGDLKSGTAGLSGAVAGFVNEMRKL